ncbi:class I SAM-dependent methyltransferase [Pontivivens insulae]|uniref:Demethylmenaquinone methyltransferase n=1 Tax=Pontivivens insulae TaxID=1639689 RepID=A0A2R8AA82_9RHOB|nr:class I SAM-dependent methyltransferase [Pontivivens insulae]RED13055.1 demethylmenaquinone methyltransferase/2-methoxy-6-polyprenyl-1,4-benzoquinol methylase [Pontivivens insulae]SPF29147.1 Demethylmenaquinone methyltransferase [Pontivivens insulae]
MSDPKDDIYDPAFVANLFDRCSRSYRRWSAISSFGFIALWRRQCVGRLATPQNTQPVVVDLMAGTGEVWPYLLRRFPDLETITALDISHRMHVDAVARLHGAYAERITHVEADALKTDLEANYADLLVSTFGLKTFNAEQQALLARQIARIVKPGGSFALIEASDPKGWMLRPVYRFYLDRVLPLVERYLLRGANDFSMIGTYTRNFGDCDQMAIALREAGLSVEVKKHFFGCATSVAGTKPTEHG